jgi:hypothetical protein
MLGSSEIGRNPQTQRKKNHEQVDDRESPKAFISPQKMWTPLHVPLTPPFIGRQRDFYIPIIPSNLKNIPNGNMYMNVFSYPWFAELTSDIYKFVIRSHSKPGLLVPRLWLGLFMTLPSFAKIDESSDSGFRSPNSSLKSSLLNCFLPPKLPFPWNGTQTSRTYVTSVKISFEGH